MNNRGWIQGTSIRVNDDDRAQWVDNDESLYDWMRSTHLGMRAFVRAHRAEIDEVITAALNATPES